MNKKAPVYRTCIVTHEKLLKSDLFRVVRNSYGVHLDLNQDMPGRGVYIKKELNVIILGQKKHSLSRGLKCDVKDDIYVELIQALNKERK